MNINEYFPNLESIVETYAFHDKPIYFLYKNKSDVSFLVIIYKLEEEIEEWISIVVSDEELTDIKNTNISLVSSIQKSSKILLLRTKGNILIKKEMVKFSQLEKDLLPNRDVYLKKNSLFNIKYDIDRKNVENLVFNNLLEKEFKDYTLKKEVRKTQYKIDGLIVKNREKILIEIKYFRYTDNIEYKKILKHLTVLVERFKLNTTSLNKLIYVIVVKNEDGTPIESVSRNFSELINSLNLSFPWNVEVRFFCIYDLIEGNYTYKKMSIIMNEKTV